MKIVRENINEAIKHLSPKTKEEIRNLYNTAKAFKPLKDLNNYILL